MNKLGKRTKWKIQRALGLELPGLGKPGALEKRAYPPGQHGPTAKRRKLDGYGLQLKEKQKLLFHYGLREEQLQRFVRDARSKANSNWMETLVGLLERRLDNLVFRLGFASSTAGARQLVSHGHVLVNGRRATIGSMVLRVGAKIQLTAKASELECVKRSQGSPRLTLPSYLALDTIDSGTVGTITGMPGAAHVPFEFNMQLVAEYYA
jgi:small subunit ribosomal protein S4